MSRRNRSTRRRTYGKRQHEVRERRLPGAQEGDWATREDDWGAPELLDERRHDDGAYEGYAR